MYDVSVIVLIYEQPKEKILLTVASVLRQEGVRKQIIIADDGSKETYISEIENFLQKRGFTDYKVIYQKENVGTVKNCLAGLQQAQGEYVKLISPGDCFTSDGILKSWIEDIRLADAKLSFCDSVYYRKGERFECIQEVARPQYPLVYRHNSVLQKKYYLLYNDIFLGASIIADKEAILKYIEMVSDRVIYGEDDVVRIMILDQIPVKYFDSKAIFYEWGEGISTKKNSAFLQMLQKDWQTTSEMILERCGNTGIDRKIAIYYKANEGRKNIYEKIIKFFIDKDVEKHNRIYSANKRLTEITELDYLDFLSKWIQDKSGTSNEIEVSL